jgi:NADH:ubiquinone oxidoreductase subunit E
MDIETQLLANTQTLIKWAEEETNLHMQSMLISTIKLSQETALYAMRPDANGVADMLMRVNTAVQKLADVYNRETKPAI